MLGNLPRYSQSNLLLTFLPMPGNLPGYLSSASMYSSTSTTNGSVSTRLNPNGFSIKYSSTLKWNCTTQSGVQMDFDCALLHSNVLRFVLVPNRNVIYNCFWS